MKFNNVIILLVTYQCVSSSKAVYQNETDFAESIQYAERDPYLEKYLREALENFRRQMKEGMTGLDIPVLDPMELTDLDINVNENLATMDLKIKTISVQGLANFEFHEIYPDLETFFLKINLTIPSIESYGKYELNGKMLKIFPLRGNGNLEINITEVEIAGVGQLEPINKTLLMTKLDLNLKWKNMNVFLENFLGGGKFSQILQKMISKTGPEVFDAFKPKILKNMNEALMNSVNKQLEKPKSKKIIEKILESAHKI